MEVIEDSSSAAALKLRNRAVASKARNAFSERRGAGMRKIGVSRGLCEFASQPSEIISFA